MNRELLKADSLKHYSLEQIKGVRNKNEEYGPILAAIVLAQKERMIRGRAYAESHPSLQIEDEPTLGATSTPFSVAEPPRRLSPDSVFLPAEEFDELHLEVNTPTMPGVNIEQRTRSDVRGLAAIDWSSLSSDPSGCSLNLEQPEQPTESKREGALGLQAISWSSLTYSSLKV